MDDFDFFLFSYLSSIIFLSKSLFFRSTREELVALLDELERQSPGGSAVTNSPLGGTSEEPTPITSGRASPVTNGNDDSVPLDTGQECVQVVAEDQLKDTQSEVESKPSPKQDPPPTDSLEEKEKIEDHDSCVKEKDESCRDGSNSDKQCPEGDTGSPVQTSAPEVIKTDSDQSHSTEPVESSKVLETKNTLTEHSTELPEYDASKGEKSKNDEVEPTDASSKLEDSSRKCKTPRDEEEDTDKPPVKKQKCESIEKADQVKEDTLEVKGDGEGSKNEGTTEDLIENNNVKSSLITSVGNAQSIRGTSLIDRSIARVPWWDSLQAESALQFTNSNLSTNNYNVSRIKPIIEKPFWERDKFTDPPSNDFYKVIEEPVLIFHGEGSGYDCLAGNDSSGDEATPTQTVEPPLQETAQTADKVTEHSKSSDTKVNGSPKGTSVSVNGVEEPEKVPECKAGSEDFNGTSEDVKDNNNPHKDDVTHEADPEKLESIEPTNFETPQSEEDDTIKSSAISTKIEVPTETINTAGSKLHEDDESKTALEEDVHQDKIESVSAGKKHDSEYLESKKYVNESLDRCSPEKNSEKVESETKDQVKPRKLIRPDLTSKETTIPEMLKELDENKKESSTDQTEQNHAPITKPSGNQPLSSSQEHTDESKSNLKVDAGKEGIEKSVSPSKENAEQLAKECAQQLYIERGKEVSEEKIVLPKIDPNKTSKVEREQSDEDKVENQSNREETQPSTVMDEELSKDSQESAEVKDEPGKEKDSISDPKDIAQDLKLVRPPCEIETAAVEQSLSQSGSVEVESNKVIEEAVKPISNKCALIRSDIHTSNAVVSEKISKNKKSIKLNRDELSEDGLKSVDEANYNSRIEPDVKSCSDSSLQKESQPNSDKLVGYTNIDSSAKKETLAKGLVVEPPMDVTLKQGGIAPAGDFEKVNTTSPESKDRIEKVLKTTHVEEKDGVTDTNKGTNSSTVRNKEGSTESTRNDLADAEKSSVSKEIEKPAASITKVKSTDDCIKEKSNETNPKAKAKVKEAFVESKIVKEAVEKVVERPLESKEADESLKNDGTKEPLDNKDQQKCTAESEDTTMPTEIKEKLKPVEKEKSTEIIVTETSDNKASKTKLPISEKLPVKEAEKKELSQNDNKEPILTNEIKEIPIESETKEKPAECLVKVISSMVEVEEKPADIEEKGKPADIEEKGKPADIKEKAKPADIEEKAKPADIEEKEKPADIEEKEKPADIEEKEKPADIEEKGKPADIEEKEKPADITARGKLSVCEEEHLESEKEEKLSLDAKSKEKLSEIKENVAEPSDTKDGILAEPDQTKDLKVSGVRSKPTVDKIGKATEIELAEKQNVPQSIEKEELADTKEVKTVESKDEERGEMQQDVSEKPIENKKVGEEKECGLKMSKTIEEDTTESAPATSRKRGEC